MPTFPLFRLDREGTEEEDHDTQQSDHILESIQNAAVFHLVSLDIPDILTEIVLVNWDNP